MENVLGVDGLFGYSVERFRPMGHAIGLKGRFVFEHWRKGRLLSTYEFKNGVTNVGKNYMLDAAFNTGSQSTNWYIGLIDGTAGTPTLAAADTSASHSGWTEFQTYTETTRQAWVKGAAATQMVASTSVAAFTIGAVADGTKVGGAFLINVNTKGGTTGVLWATGNYPASVPVQQDDVFKVNYVTSLT